MQHYELNLRDYWRIIKKKKIIVIITVVMLSSFSLFFAILNKPTPLYQATASLKIQRSTSYSNNDYGGYYWGGGDDLATRAEIIKSYPMIEKAAQVMGLLDSSLTPDEIRSNKKYFDITFKLKKRVKTEQEGYTNLINIIITDEQPERAQDLANALAKVYSQADFGEKNEQTKQAIDAIKAQLANAKATYQQSVNVVRKYREDNKFATIEGSSGRLSSQMDAAEKQLESIQADITQINNIVAEISLNPDYIFYSSFNLLLNTPNATLSMIQSQMNGVRSDLENYSQHYTDQHPIVIDLKSQLAGLKTRFISELRNFRESLVRAEIVAQRNYTKLENEYRSLPTIALTLIDLERELDINSRLYEQSKVAYAQVMIRQSEQTKEVLIARPALLPTSPINPNTVGPTAAVGTIIGLILGVVLAFVAETLDTAFSTIDDIEKTLDTTVLGVIPFVDIEDIKLAIQEKVTTPIPEDILEMQARMASHYDPKSVMAESFRGLRTNIHFGLMDKGYKSIMITSSVAGEGKTTIATNLALAMAQIGQKTLLVEADLRKPRISKLFGIEREPGLTDVILRRETLDSVIRNQTDLMMGTLSSDAFQSDSIAGIEYLNILTAGKIEKNPSEIIASKLMNEVLDELKERYDIIIFDSAPVIQATDSTVLGAKVDTTLLTYYQGKISRGTLRRSKSQLEMLKSDVLGIVLNGMRADVTADYADYKYSYDSHYSYGETEEEKGVKGIFSNVGKFFTNKKEGLHLDFFQKLKIGKLLLSIGVTAIVIGAALLGFHALRSRPSVTPPAQQMHSQGDSTTPAIPIIQTEVQSDTQSVKVPQQLQPDSLVDESELQEVKPSLVPVKVPAQVPTQVTTAERQSTPPPAAQKPVVREQAPAIAQAPVRIIQQRPAASSSSPVKIFDIAQPFSILLATLPDYQSARTRLLSYRDQGLAAFMNADFSNPEQKNYLVCYGSFISESAAQTKGGELAMLGFKGTMAPYKFEYAISLGKYNSKISALGKLNDLGSLKDYAYIQPVRPSISNAAESVILIGGFNNTDHIDLFKRTIPELSAQPVVYR